MMAFTSRVGRVGTISSGLLAALCAGGPAFGQSPLFVAPASVGPVGHGNSSHCLASIGDVTGDGVPDFAVGSYAGNIVTVYSGADGSVVTTIVGAGGTFGTSHLGFAVAAAGDVNADGFPDIAATRWDNTFTTNNELSEHSGATGARLGAWTPPVATYGFGGSLAPVGDLDSDGFADLAVGSEGMAFVVSGQARTTLLAMTALGVDPVEVGPAPDLDGDGSPELALGLSGEPSPNQNARGAVRFVTASGALVSQWSAPASLNEFGRTLSGVGDLDGDGSVDIAVYSWDGGSGDIFGRVDAFSPKLVAPLWHRTSPSGNFAALGYNADAFGLAIAGGGDVNGDGRPDVVIGAEDSSDVNFGGATGATFVLDGSDGTLLACPPLPTPNPYGHFGASVAMLGDVDGDGAADVGVVAAGAIIAFACKDSSLVAYGAGCPGVGGFVPHLDGSIAPGNVVTLDLTQARGGSVALFAFGNYPAHVPAAGLCTLWLQPVLPQFLLLPTSGSGAGVGTASITAAAPAGFRGELMTQAFVADPSMPSGYAATNAVQIVLH